MTSLFNRDLSWPQRWFGRHLFEVFATGICVLVVQNMAPELLQIGQICLFVCLYVCSTFCKLFFGPILSRIHLQFHEKSAKNRFCNRFP